VVVKMHALEALDGADGLATPGDEDGSGREQVRVGAVRLDQRPLAGEHEARLQRGVQHVGAPPQLRDPLPRAINDQFVVDTAGKDCMAGCVHMTVLTISPSVASKSTCLWRSTNDWAVSLSECNCRSIGGCCCATVQRLRLAYTVVVSPCTGLQLHPLTLRVAAAAHGSHLAVPRRDDALLCSVVDDQRKCAPDAAQRVSDCVLLRPRLGGVRVKDVGGVEVILVAACEEV